LSQSKRPGHRISKKSSGRGLSVRDRAKQRRHGLQKHPFKIEHMDGLGQGVCKQDGAISFIAKTLPDETGTARIYKRSKGVQFARLESLDQPAGNRIEPECEHFNQCPGCHYLHTDYQSELGYKKAALTKIMQPLIAAKGFNADAIEVIAAEQRLAYRNRMQLHYRHKYIGLIDSASDQIVEIPNCKIIRPELQQAFDSLYSDTASENDEQSTQKGKGKDKGKGHCELYLDGDTVKQTWDADYAEGGFSQVNEAMNEELKQLVNSELQAHKSKNNEGATCSVLDLFSGNGNLSNDIGSNSTIAIERTMIDIADNEHADYFKIDLFDDTALKQFKKQNKAKAFDKILLDPPRKGFPALADWVKQYKPKHLIYVSCNAATMARDLQSLECRFSIDKILLLDLFPASYHFETVDCISF
jgi:23S rRNA (uracil1939-C5)-methyltransferase